MDNNNRAWREEDQAFIQHQWRGTREALAEAISQRLGTMITEYDALQDDIRQLKYGLTLPQLSIHQIDLLDQELRIAKITRRNLKGNFRRLLVRQTHVRNYVYHA